MTGLAIGSIKARDEISEVVVVIAFRTRLLDTFVLVHLLLVSLDAELEFYPRCVLEYIHNFIADSGNIDYTKLKSE